MRKESLNSSHFSIISDKYFEMDYLEKNGCNDFSKEKFKLINKSSLSSRFIMMKETQNPEFMKNDKQTDNFKACIYMIIAITQFSFINLGGKIMLEFFPEIDNITTCFFRGLITMSFAIVYINIYKIQVMQELKKDSKKTILLLIRNFLAAFCNYSIFEAFKYMRISSAFTLYNTSPIFASIYSVIFLNSKFTQFDFFSLIVCFVSVCLISKPGFLNFIFHSDIYGEDSYIGVIIVLVSANLVAIMVILNKMIAQDFHFVQSTFFYGMFFIFDSTFLGVVKNLTDEGGFNIFQNMKNFGYLSFSIVILIGTITFFNINIYTYAVNIGDPVVVLPLTYIGIVLNMIFNSFVFGKKTDILDILGSSFIIGVNIKRILDQRKK